MVANILTCQGFSGPAFGGGCTMAWVGIPILFFVLALVNKWGGEEMGFEFSFLWANVLGFLSYFLIVTISASFKIALGVAIVIGLVGGFMGGQWFGGGDY